MTRNQETIDEILRLRDKGAKVQEIADHFGVSKERLYQVAGAELKAWQEKAAAEQKIEREKAKPKRKMDIRKVRNMMANGSSMQEVADYFGVTKQAIYLRVKEDESRKAALGTLARKVGQGEHRLVDPETGLVVDGHGITAQVIGRMGDERVSAFVRYHMEMLAMRQGVDKQDVTELYNRFLRYLGYCEEHGIVPNNMNAYFAIGISRDDIRRWSNGTNGTPEHKQFAEDIKAFFASIHEQGGTDGVLNPISAMFWQKAHDGMIEASKLEVVAEDPLGEKRSAEDIAKAYSEVDLPD